MSILFMQKKFDTQWYSEFGLASQYLETAAPDAWVNSTVVWADDTDHTVILPWLQLGMYASLRMVNPIYWYSDYSYTNHWTAGAGSFNPPFSDTFIFQMCFCDYMGTITATADNISVPREDTTYGEIAEIGLTSPLFDFSSLGHSTPRNSTGFFFRIKNQSHGGHPGAHCKADLGPILKGWWYLAPIPH